MLCMGVQASIFPESFSWLNHFTAFVRRREPIPPISIDWVAIVESHACGFQSCLLPLTWASEKEAQSEGVQAFIHTWSRGKVTASEESRKESCVVKPSIEGLIGGGSITVRTYSGSRWSDMLISISIHKMQRYIRICNTCQWVKLTMKCKCPDVRKQLWVQMSTHGTEYDLLWLC